jgi:chorismate mutase
MSADNTTLDLSQLRREIDRLDTEWVRLLAQRFEVTRQVGKYKRDHGLPPRDPSREEQQLAVIRSKAAAAGLSPDLAASILRLVIDEVVTNHIALRDET